MAENADRAVLLVAEAVSDALEVPIEELPPLSESINLDGLDALVNHREATDVSIVFSYAGLRVFIHSEGLVYVRPRCAGGDTQNGRLAKSRRGR